ncbi:transposase [Paraburkholderia tuberum]|uniref:Transposase n=1 Tax=Paraburkholderia tuberum TaxID=157910 RepID=A0A1H1K1V4_9BURK|nr:transposase [Paraburkholderia tuberum]SDR55919.1 transposase [Paraburkholderia tuberum]
MTKFAPTSNLESFEILIEQGHRRRPSVEEKLAIVQDTFAPGETVSGVAWRYSVNAKQVFAWRRQYEEGGLTAVKAGEAVVRASELAAAIEEIRGLQRILGKMTMENQILREAVERGCAENLMVRPPLLRMRTIEDRL